MSRKPPQDQDYFYAPNTPYPKDKWIHIPYVRYSRRESLLQNLAMGCSCAFSLLLFIATIFFNGLGNEYNASLCPVSEPVRRTLTAICGLLIPIAFVLFVWLVVMLPPTRGRAFSPVPRSNSTSPRGRECTAPVRNRKTTKWA